MAQGKAGLVGGVLLALGAGLARFGDDCGRAGMRGARLSDDLAGGAAGAGRTMHWGPDDAARLGGRGLGRPGARGVALGDGVAGARAHGSWSEALLESGMDVGIEVVQMDLEGVPVQVVEADEIRCPRVLEAADEPKAWSDLLGGLGVACAPVVVVGIGEAEGASLRMGDEVTPLSELARQCLDVEAQCVFIGCPADAVRGCTEAAKASLRRTRLQLTLRSFVRTFSREFLERAPRPVTFARVSPSRGGLVVAESGRGD